jgi:hypothetical protein
VTALLPEATQTVVAGGPPPFDRLNRLADPLVRLGLGAPLPLPGWTPGLIVLEVVGRRSGRRIRVPLVAANRGDAVIVTTGRPGRSQWLKNLARMPRARLWLRGRLRHAAVATWHPDGPALPAPDDPLDRAVLATLRSLGLGGALLDLGAAPGADPLLAAGGPDSP